MLIIVHFQTNGYLALFFWPGRGSRWPGGPPALYNYRGNTAIQCKNPPHFEFKSISRYSSILCIKFLTGIVIPARVSLWTPALRCHGDGTGPTCWRERSLGKGLSMSSSSLEECMLWVLTCSSSTTHHRWKRRRGIRERVSDDNFLVEYLLSMSTSFFLPSGVSVISRYKPFQNLPSSDITSKSVHPDVRWLDKPTSWYSPLDRLVG